MKKILLSYWGIIFILVAVAAVFLFLFKPDIGEPRTEILQYDDKFDCFYVMENEAAVPIYGLASNNHLIEGMGVDIYEYRMITYVYPKGTPREVVRNRVYTDVFTCVFVLCLVVVMMFLIYRATTGIGYTSGSGSEGSASK